MSPFLYADQIQAPLLLLHNLDDTNVGTNPIQERAHVRGDERIGARR